MSAWIRSANKKRNIYSVLAISVFFSLGASFLSVAPFTRSAYASTADGDCTLIAPREPLSATGLATPYLLVATNPQNGPCHEANASQSAFVQGVILNPNTGQVRVYNPLVIDQGTQPAVRPQPPMGGKIPPEDVVALWIGANSQHLELQGDDLSLQNAHCVTGGPERSPFGPFAYCNAVNFFAAANKAMQTGKLVPPPLEMSEVDDMICPTIRDFSLVDQKQSDGVSTTYRVTTSGQIEQDTQANNKIHPGRVITNNGSHQLLVAIDKALRCPHWTVPDLADPGNASPALPLDELQADMLQGEPMALVPNRNTMTLVDGKPSLPKLNAYRAGVDQPQESDSTQSNTTVYCQHLLAVAPTRMRADASALEQQPSPNPVAANSLLTFLAQRFGVTYGGTGLDCIDKLTPKQPNPIAIQTDMNGVATSVTINGQTLGDKTKQAAPTQSNATPFDCVLNGKKITGCNGTTTMNGQTCTISFLANMRRVVIDCK